MRVYKYLNAENGLRFLKEWTLRITPPADFNDPFELRPLVSEVFTEDHFFSELDRKAEKHLIEEVTQQFRAQSAGVLSSEECTELITSLISPSSPETKSNQIGSLKKRIPSFSPDEFFRLQREIQAQWPVWMNNAKEQIRLLLPEINSMVEAGFIEKLPSLMGVVCLSRNANQPLMWAHYADSHRGMLLEFEADHPTFNRRRGNQDEFGFLREVSYSKVRPEVTLEAAEGDRLFEYFALTKSAHWSYEEEVRLLFPLEYADKTIELSNGKIHLLSVARDALISVTLGCKASSQLNQKVQQVLSNDGGASHVLLQRARLDAYSFDLKYERCF